MKRFAFWHELVLALLLGGLLFYAHKVEPDFVSRDVQFGLASNSWERAILAVPMTLIIITAGIDLSIGSIIALCAVVLGMTFEQTQSLWLSAALAIAVGAAAGACNGFFIAKLRVHPLIVTLATLAAFRGIAEGVSKAAAFHSDRFAELGVIHGMPIAGPIFGLAAIAASLVLLKSPLGRSVYAIGFNETATRFSGVPVARIKLLIYTLSGVAAAIAAVLLVARNETAKADLGNGIELDVITMVVLGGVSIFGGRGNLIGVLLGIALVHETREFVSWHWTDNTSSINNIVIGALLIGSVLLNRLLSVRGRTN